MSDESECEAELKTFMSGKGMDIVSVPVPAAAAAATIFIVFLIDEKKFLRL